jgi:hypothetical protein
MSLTTALAQPYKGIMSLRRNTPQQPTRYDLARKQVADHFERGTLRLAPADDSRRTEVVDIGESEEVGKLCSVCPWVISSPLPGERPPLAYVYRSGVVLRFHRDCHAAWLTVSAQWRSRH